MPFCGYLWEFKSGEQAILANAFEAGLLYRNQIECTRNTLVTNHSLGRFIPRFGKATLNQPFEKTVESCCNNGLASAKAATWN